MWWVWGKGGAAMTLCSLHVSSHVWCRCTCSISSNKATVSLKPSLHPASLQHNRSRLHKCFKFNDLLKWSLRNWISVYKWGHQTVTHTPTPYTHTHTHMSAHHSKKPFLSLLCIMCTAWCEINRMEERRLKDWLKITFAVCALNSWWVRGDVGKDLRVGHLVTTGQQTTANEM